MTVTPLHLTTETSAQRPDSLGRFGQFGGKYVPETLMPALFELEAAFHKYSSEPEFQQQLSSNSLAGPRRCILPSASPSIMLKQTELARKFTSNAKI